MIVRLSTQRASFFHCRMALASPQNITLMACERSWFMAASKPACNPSADQSKRCVMSGSTSTRFEDISSMHSGYVFAVARSNDE